MSHLSLILHCHWLTRRLKLSLLVCATYCASVSSAAQSKILTYHVFAKGDTIGQMQVERRSKGEEEWIMVASSFTVQWLVNMKVDVQEQTHYLNGKLVYSKVHRMVNDKPKAIRETKQSGDHYLLINNGRENKLNLPRIGLSISALYFKEPIGVARVYSDYHQKYFTIEPLAQHAYKINLPEGSSNVYYYDDGVCNKVAVRTALFSAQMILNP